MGPRPDGRGIVERPDHDVRMESLQWGRDQMAAGSCPLGITVGATVNLQWGRDQMAAGSRHPRPAGNRDRDLQWGRDQMAAGSAYATASMCDAAIPSMGPRPDGRGIRLLAIGGTSITRPFNGAATRWPRDLAPGGGRDGNSIPSMGPRPDGRGIAPASSYSPLESDPFNGAATRWPRDRRRA